MAGVKAEIKNALGAFVSLHQKDLLEQLMQKHDTLVHLRTIMSEAQKDNMVGIPSSQLSDVVQGYQKAFTPMGELTTSAETTIQRRHKIDLLVNPDDIVGEWEGFLYDEKKSRAEMPLVKYILQKLLEKIQDEKERLMVYTGVYQAPVANTPNPADKSVDGFEKILANAAIAGKFDPFIMGAFTADQTFEYMEEFLSSIPALHRYRKLKLYMSDDVRLDYQRDKRNTFKYFENLGNLLKIDFSNMEIAALPAMAGKKKIIATVPGNLVRVIHKNQSADNLQVQEDVRDVKIFGDWHECYGVADYRYLWTNDQV